MSAQDPDVKHLTKQPNPSGTDKKKKVPGISKEAKAVRAGSSVRDDRNSNKPAQQFAFVLGPQEKALHDYLRCIFNPSKYQARVPASTGGFELYTQLWKTYESRTAVADSAGNAVAGVCANNWVESSNYDGTPDPSCGVLGWSNNGSALITTTGAAVNGGLIPAIGANFGTAGYASAALAVPTDTFMNAYTRIRLVAIELKVHSVMSANNSKGELLLAGTVNPTGGIQAGNINNNYWSDIMATNDAVMTKAVFGLNGWKSEQAVSIVGIPAETQAFEMCQCPTSGYNYGNSNTPIINIAALARGMTPGDSFSVEVTYVWETEMARTNSVNSSAQIPVAVPSSTLDVAKARARPYAVNPMDGIHALPWVETLGVTNPSGLNQFMKHPDAAKHAQSLGLRPSSQVVAYAPAPSFLDSLGGLAKSGLKFLGNSSAVSKIPVIGGAVSGIASVLSKLFD